MRFVIDASVAIKWVFDESGADSATTYLLRPTIAPELFQAEVGHVLTRGIRRGELSAAQARAGFKLISDRVALSPMGPRGQAALALSLELSHAIYDCYYLAAAEVARLPFVTADAVFIRKLRASGRGGQVYLLGEEVPDV